MSTTIFSKLTIDGKSDVSALSDIQKYQQLAALLRQRYQPLNAITPLIEDMEEAKSVSFAFSEFNQQFNAIHQEVNRFIGEKERNLNLALASVRKYDELFNRLEPVYQQYKEKILSSTPQLESIYRDIKMEQVEYITSLNAQWSSLQTQLSEKIEKGVETLLEVKMTQGITGAFKDQIINETTRNRREAKIYFVLFIITLMLIPISIGGIYFVDQPENIDWYDFLIIKLSIAIPLIWIARWFSKNYAHARLASIKFDHLNRLLGEGANTIAKLVEIDPVAKSEVYRRFAELFLDIKDLESIAVKQPKHPFEDLKDLVELKKLLGK